MTTTTVNATASTDDWRTIFQSRDVTWLWAGQVISQIGDGLTKMSMSLLWLVYHLTGSSLKMGPAASGILIATIDVQHVLHVTADAFVLSILWTIPIPIPHELVPSSYAGILTQAGQALMGAYGLIHTRSPAGAA